MLSGILLICSSSFRQFPRITVSLCYVSATKDLEETLNFTAGYQLSKLMMCTCRWISPPTLSCPLVNFITYHFISHCSPSINLDYVHVQCAEQTTQLQHLKYDIQEDGRHFDVFLLCWFRNNQRIEALCHQVIPLLCIPSIPSVK